MTAIVAGVGASVIVSIISWRRQRTAEKDLATGAAPTVFAAIRRTGAGWWRGRWRHGFVTVMPTEVCWRPRRPRPGPPVRLRGVRVSSSPRGRSWHERWWLAPGVGIYQLTGDDGVHDRDTGTRYELAVVAESTRLFERALTQRPPEA